MKHQLILFYICLHSPDLVLRLALLWLGRAGPDAFLGSPPALLCPTSPSHCPHKIIATMPPKLGYPAEQNLL